MPPFTFGPDRRLRSHIEFVRAQRTGRRVATRHFTLLVAKQPNHGTAAVRASRIGLVVTGKVGPAAKRNRIRRVCRECFRTWPDLLPRGVDLVVIARQGAHELSPLDVRTEWLAVSDLLCRRATEALAGANKQQPATRTPKSG